MTERREACARAIAEEIVNKLTEGTLRERIERVLQAHGAEFPALLDVAIERPGMSHRYAPGLNDCDLCKVCGEGPIHAWHAEARLLDVVDEQVEDDSGYWFDMGQKQGFRLAAGMLELEHELRAGRGNAPSRGWLEAAKHLADGAEEMSVRPRAALRSHSSPPESQEDGWKKAVADIGMGGIYDVFSSAEDAIRQLGQYIEECRRTIACPENRDLNAYLFEVAALASSPLPGHEK